jgi:D-lactate dehydrogenase
MVRALADGRLRGAGLGVLPQQPLIREEAAIVPP